MEQKLAMHPKMIDVNIQIQYGQTFLMHYSNCITFLMCYSQLCVWVSVRWIGRFKKWGIC